MLVKEKKKNEIVINLNSLLLLLLLNRYIFNKRIIIYKKVIYNINKEIL